MHTLGGNPRLPAKEIRAFYSNQQWDVVKDLPYDGYVVLRGTIRRDRTLVGLRIVETYPDDSRNGTAQVYAAHARLSGTTVGGRIRPTGEIYVVFYETHSTPHRALLFGQSLSSAAAIDSVGGDRFLSVFTF